MDKRDVHVQLYSERETSVEQRNDKKWPRQDTNTHRCKKSIHSLTVFLGFCKCYDTDLCVMDQHTKLTKQTAKDTNCRKCHCPTQCPIEIRKCFGYACAALGTRYGQQTNLHTAKTEIKGCGRQRCTPGGASCSCTCAKGKEPRGSASSAPNLQRSHCGASPPRFLPSPTATETQDMPPKTRFPVYRQDSVASRCTSLLDWVQ